MVRLLCRTIRSEEDFKEAETAAKQAMLDKQQQMGVNLVVGPLKSALLEALTDVESMEDIAGALEHKADLELKTQQQFMSDWSTR